MSFAFTLHKGRTSDHTILLYESDGSTSITLAADDEVRVKVWRRDQATPDLDIDSAANSSNGSGITIDELGTSPTAQVTLRISEGDTSSLSPGVYDAEVSVADASESNPANALKHVEMGVVYLLATGGGDSGVA